MAVKTKRERERETYNIFSNLTDLKHYNRMITKTQKVYLIIAFTKKLELLCFLVHEYTIKVASFDGTNLNCFVTPAHDLTSTDVCCKYISPITQHVTGYSCIPLLYSMTSWGKSVPDILLS